MSPRSPCVLAVALLAGVASCAPAEPLAPADHVAPPPGLAVARDPGSLARASSEGAYDDAIVRLAPALATYDDALRGALQRLRAADAASRATAARDVGRALDALERSAPAELQPDLAALRLDLEAIGLEAIGNRTDDPTP